MKGIERAIGISDPQDEEKIETQLIEAAMKAGYIKMGDDYSTIPEYEILKLILDSDSGLSIEEIKQRVSSVTPVHISRTISKLEAEDRIVEEEDSKWRYTPKFRNLMIEEELQEQARLEELEVQKVEEERMEALKAKEKRSDSLVKYLLDTGYIRPQSTEMKDLMKEPDFEILSIINDEGPIGTKEIKEKTESVSPVLVGRTISKLEADDMIRANLEEKWMLSDSLKAKLK
ncbi:MAG: hypothetical protein ACXAD7_28220, partial [Candidatus Kariarchaeaceae archaeon]|jgi:DNA-binding HxlR family transcriptional regulator